MHGILGLLRAVCLLQFVFSGHGFLRVAKLSPIAVELGRSVFLDPLNDLKITFPEGTVCKVSVLRNDPLSQRVGFMVPDIFPCDFSLGDVQYSHLGSMFFMQDFVKLQVRADTETQTRLIPLNLHVTVSFSDMEIINKNLPITVVELGGISTSINRDVLAFKDDPNKICSVTILNFNSGIIPRYGQLVNVTKEGSNSTQYECGEFLRSNIRYQHKKLSSSNRDFIPLVVELIDQNTHRIEREYFQIIVRILEARSNQRPVASFQASNTVEVNQYTFAPITSDILAASDTETDVGEIIFNITQALQLGEGSLVNTDDPYQPLTAFYQRDIEQFKIAYRPPAIQKSELRMFQVLLEAVDTEGAKSEQISLLIMVKPTNNDAPMVTKNAGLSLFEGQSRAITEKSNLAITDKDNFNDVLLQVIGGLRHGELRIMGHKIETFMATELEIPVITYHHDNSDTYSDNIIFRLSDGKHDIKFLFPITIGPVDDTAPMLAHNTGLTLNEGEIALVDRYMLSATDIDSEDSKIQFKVISFPNFEKNSGSSLFQENNVGVLCLRMRNPPERGENWVLQDDGFYEQNVTQFSQSDIIDRRLYYRHLGGEFFSDEIAFVMFDEADNPNASPIKTFQVTIRRVDDLPPSLFPGCPLEITADEYGTIELSEEVLHYTDKDSQDEELAFFITKEPHFIDENPNITELAGEIILSDSKIKVLRFTQLQVRHKKISFKSPDLELGTRTRYAQFEFSVSDLAGNTIRNQVFRVVLKPVNNQAPRAVVRPLEVVELSQATLGNEQLRVFDEDSTDEEITFTVTAVPRYGVLLKDELEMQYLDTFRVPDITTSRMRYQHVTKGEASDELGLTVDDGIHKTNFLLEIAIIPEHKNVTCHVYNMTVTVKEHSRKAIKIHTTSQTPRDTEIILRIASPPRVGRILRHGKMSYEFSVQDLEAGLIVYEHIGRETGLHGDVDRFNMTLLNDTETWIREGRRYEAVDVVTMILPVDSQPPMVSRIKQLVVLEGGKTKLTSRQLTITDPDTRDSDVTCSVDVQPTVGFLENVTPSPGSEISNAGKRVTSFTIDDIRAGRISYVQDVYEGSEPTMDWVAFSCSDGNNTSPRYLLNIDIIPQNDEKPQIFTRDFYVDEGDEKFIDVTVLNAVDSDEPLDELMFFVVTPPRHGMITDRRKGATKPVPRFSLTQIKKSTSIVYQHDGSESTRDSFILSVSDGKFNTTRSIPVIITPVDDEEPTLYVNTGLRIASVGESKTITPNNLKAQDVDSPDEDIMFVVRSPPRAGFLRRINVNGSVQIFAQWQRFTQRDIDERRIVYSQDANIPTERDMIKFDLSDGNNTRLNQDFYVEISAGDRIHPTVINKGVRLAQDSRIIISTNFLSASDAGSANEKLRYFLVKQPQNGRLEHLDFPGVRLASFTQLDLAGNKIIYIHTSSDEATADSFDFEVSDGTNGVVRTFLVTLINIDNKHPVLIHNKLVVNEGENVLITPFELRAEDQDTQPGNLVYTITRVPLHGWLLNSGMPSRVFTQEDINLNRISYAHDGTDVDKDSFQVKVSDGTHHEFYVFPDTDSLVREPREIHVAVVPVDNRIPQLVLNQGATNLEILPSHRIGLVIRSSALRVEDLDSNNSELLYTVTYPPVNGILVTQGRYNSNKSVMNFTQSDIDAGNISYVLHNGHNATNDAFDFDVSDPAGNTLRFQRFSFTWAWVSFERQIYQLSETDGVVRFDIVRRGFLGDPSSVRLNVKGITATQGQDFLLAGPLHVQFSPGQSRAEWKLHVQGDGKYEGNETLEVELKSPQMCVIRQPKIAHVTITDPEDVPTVEIVRSHLVVEEDIGEIKIPLRRTGDTSQRLYVSCVTTSLAEEEGWATGTLPTSVLSYSDFISRPANKDSVITFEKEETTKECPVIIIDDSLYENEEKFYVRLISHLGSKINSERNSSVVVIAPDAKDEPKIFFDHPHYSVDESIGELDVSLRRTGTDLSKPSSVFARSRQTDPISARGEYKVYLGLEMYSSDAMNSPTKLKELLASEDYIPLIQMVYFPPFSEHQTVHVTIRDDQGLPRVEGTEKFELVLRTPINTGIGETSKAVIAIDDLVSDSPMIQFDKISYSTSEEAGTLNVVLMRTGDLRSTSSVRCYTRYMTAEVERDFKERADTDASLIVFNPGENRKLCPVAIIDDVVFEEREKFRLKLGSVDKDSRIGERNASVITIVDLEDKPIIQFTKERTFVVGPAVPGASREALITVKKTGDPTTRSKVRVYTLDGSAKAGKGYQPITEILEFSGNKSSHVLTIKILFDAHRKIRRAFTVHLSSDITGESGLGIKKVIVYIEQPSTTPTVTFPLSPKVVSLRDYDDVSGAGSEIITGYPLICVTACDPKYPRYAETGSICSSQRIDNSLTQYRWQVGDELRDLTSDTFFTRADQVTLDSVYLVPGSRVRCAARAISDRGELGLESTSAQVNVSSKEGLCVSRDPHRVGSQQIVASISFTGATGDKYSNKVHIKLVLPHTDGLVPLISTKRLTNFKRILRPGVLRVAQHKCSNLLDLNELITNFGFVTNSIKDRKSMNEGEPYQFSVGLRSNRTLRFYRNLDLESCVWTFNSYYDLSELTQYCGASVTSNEQSRDIAQSQLTVRVPLYVSYVYRVPRNRGDWIHYDHAMFLRLHLTYDTAVLLNNGVQTPEGGLFNGDLWPTAISVREQDKRLVVNFKTKTKFRGTYLIKNPNTQAMAVVMSRDRPHLSFALGLVSSEQTFDYPQQTWRFQSQYALRDYTGIYFIKLIPCSTDSGVRYSEPPTCHPRDPVTFTLPIRFQQVPDPVPAQFTLSAKFLLLAERDLWLNKDADKMGDFNVDAAFSRDSKIYGRITLLEGSGLGRGSMGYALAAEKVYLCTGIGEFIPTYDPLKNKFGCMARSLYLEHRLKVLDREEPKTTDKHLGNVPFEAKFAQEEIVASNFSEDPGCDGFVMNSAPLFEVPRSRKWFMHAIYSVTSDSRPRSARSVGGSSSDENHVTSHILSEVDSRLFKLSHRLYRRDSGDTHGIGLHGQGTNIKMIRLLSEPAEIRHNTPSEEIKQAPSDAPQDTSLVNPLVIGIAGVCLLLLIALVVVGVMFRRRLLIHQTQNSPTVETSSTEVTVTQGGGVSV